MDDDESSQPDTVIDIAYCPCGRCKVEVTIDFKTRNFQIETDLISEQDDI